MGRFGRNTNVLFLLWSILTVLLLSTTQCAFGEEQAEGDGEEVAASTNEAAATTDKAAATLRKTWTLLHSVESTGEENDTSFTPRGKITLEIQPDKKKTDAAAAEPAVLTIENQADCMSQDAVNKMMATGWYQLKLVEEDDDDSKKAAAAAAPPVLTTVPACRMRLANFRDELLLTFGTNGHVISLTSMPLVSPLAAPNCQDESLLPKLPAVVGGDDDGDGSNNNHIKVESRISFETAVPGMTLRAVLPTYQPPPGLKYLNSKSSSSGNSAAAGSASNNAGGATSDKPPQGVFGGSNEKEAPPDNSMFGFLSRYWYIIAPIVLINLLSGEAPQEGPQPQQGGGGGGQAPQVQQGGQASAAAPAAAPTGGGGGGGGGGGSVRQRRGKRG